jgi:hypothetical protein
MKRNALIAIIIAAILLIGGIGIYFSGEKKSSAAPLEPVQAALPPAVDWEECYKFNKQGYEPSLVVDSKGYMYYTAHKNMDDKTTWDYLASWFFVGSPDGKTWASPSEPFPRGNLWKTYAGDEGDLAEPHRGLEK